MHTGDKAIITGDSKTLITGDFKTMTVAFVIPCKVSDTGTMSIMVGRKKTGLGVGKLTLFGGKVEVNESPQQAMIRELAEEAFVKPKDAQKLGRLVMEIQDIRLRLIAHIFRCSDVIGQPTESYEMTVEWVPVSDIPYDQMWADNKYWMPYLLSGQSFEGEFVFADIDTLIKHTCGPRTPRSLSTIVASAYTTPTVSYASIVSSNTVTVGNKSPTPLKLD